VITTALVVLAPMALGVSLTAALWPEALGSARRLAVLVVAGCGLGFGISSMVFFLGLVAADHGAPAGLAFGIETGLCAVCIAVALMRLGGRSKSVRAPRVRQAPALSWETAALGALLLAAAVGATRLFVLRTMESPHGGWDAWAIWNLHARFLFHGSPLWREMFTPLLAWSHPDYPLLLPAGIARLWAWLGDVRLCVPQAVAAAFTMGSAAMLFCGLQALATRRSALAGTAVLLCTPSFIAFGAMQMADVPLAFLYVATLTLYLLLVRGRGPAGLAVLTGAMLGMTAWTKNEGWSLVMALPLAAALTCRRDSEARLPRASLAGFLVGLLAVAGVALAARSLAPPNDILAAQAWESTTSKLLDGARYRMTLVALARSLWAFGDYRLPLVAALAGLATAAGRRVPSVPQPGLRIAATALGLVLLQYLAAYVVTPQDLEWHLTTLGRLLHQLYPSALLLFFASLNWPASERCPR
jgi:hypothetical protein